MHGFGKSLEAAKKSILEAMRLYIECRKTRKRIPAARTVHAETVTFALIRRRPSASCCAFSCGAAIAKFDHVGWGGAERKLEMCVAPDNENSAEPVKLSPYM